MRINGEVPEWIARAATAHTIPLIHFSTDYVFDGVRGRYAEDAPQRPLNVYGETKRVGETAVLDAGGYVFRLQWVYDVRGQNFLLTMKKLLAERDVLSVVADQVGAPSSARDIATAIVRATAKILAHQMPAGVYHLAAAGYTSWHGFACAIADSMASATRIIPITSAEYPLPATRPLDGRLDCSALTAQGITMPHWRDGLNALLTENAG
jgi:dTDP-4-dehydrorhamnose reductase